jgi:hypothetical protein
MRLLQYPGEEATLSMNTQRRMGSAGVRESSERPEEFLLTKTGRGLGSINVADPRRSMKEEQRARA